MSSDRRLSEQAPTVNPNGRAYIKGRQLMVHGKPFLVQGICYSPVPVNESVYWKPTGDYFTNEYSFIWLRDLPLIKAMGANVVRTYGWDPNKDHSDFLDAVHANGLYLMTTFYIGDASESPVSTQAQRDALISKFALQVSQYKSHPALMIWSFGNEMNGVWNGFLQQLGKSEVDPCGWDERYDDLGGCWVHKGKAPEPDSPCYASTQCVYSRMFKFLDQAAAAAHAEADVIVVSTFADVDALYDKVNRTGFYAPNLDAWSAQVYRGNTFGDFFEGISNVSAKPILLTEYGVDAYHDVCGKDETTTPCFNTLDNPMGSYEDEESQAAYAVNLTREIQWHSSARPECDGAGVGDVDCSAIGGFLMSWVDEYWKGSKTQASCKPTYDNPKFSPKTCDLKAHVTCGNWNTSQHDLCGYWLGAAPDHYVNEEWFGMTAPEVCADNLNALRPRQVYYDMAKEWGASRPSSKLFISCEQMVDQRCADLGKPGVVFPWLASAILFLSHGVGGGHPAPRGSGSSASDIVVCSGHGKCTTDFKECGLGGPNFTATPCCTCDLGFAGAGCDELDARMYAALGVLSVAVLLVLAMLSASVGRLAFKSRDAKLRRSGLATSTEMRAAAEPFLS
eukprot:Transcript_8539.p1 GENE.Transcript_8539~~Transcript_8539.p1  ORF type:complete len:620 (+),score=255.77 Transcript_8539:1407-3266(+)